MSTEYGTRPETTNSPAATLRTQQPSKGVSPLTLKVSAPGFEARSLITATRAGADTNTSRVYSTLSMVKLVVATARPMSSRRL